MVRPMNGSAGSRSAVPSIGQVTMSPRKRASQRGQTFSDKARSAPACQQDIGRSRGQPYATLSHVTRLARARLWVYRLGMAFGRAALISALAAAAVLPWLVVHAQPAPPAAALT